MLKENDLSKNITSSKANFTIKSIGTYKNTLGNVYFLEDFMQIFLNKSFIIYTCRFPSEALYFIDDAETTIPVLLFSTF